MTSPITSPLTRKLTYAMTAALGTVMGLGGSVAAYIPPWVALDIASLTAPAGYLYARVAAHGAADGSSWDDATTLNSVNTLVGQAADGNLQIVCLAGEGDFTPTVSQTITNDGASRNNPVVIRGVNADLTDAMVTITGNRAPVFAPGATTGNNFLKFGATAGYITFSHINFKAWGGTGTFLFNTTGAHDIAVLDCAGENLYRFIDSNSVNVSRITVKRFDGVTVGGFERSFSRFRGDSHDIYIEDVDADGAGHIDDAFQVGFSLEDTAHFVIYRRCIARNWRQITADDVYENGDGSSSERDNHGILSDHCESYGCTDGGFDFKSTNTYFRYCKAGDNKNNYRTWGDAILVRPISLEPHKRGGTGVQCHFNIAQNNTPNLHIIDATRIDTDPSTKTFYVETGSDLRYSALAGSSLGDLAQYDGVDPLGTITEIAVPGAAPVITSSASPTVAENSGFTLALTATGSPLYWELTGGADRDLFLLNGWILARDLDTPTLTLAAQNFEHQADANGDNIYEVEITAYGEGGAASAPQTVRVTVSDVGYEGLNVYEGDYFEMPLGLISQNDPDAPTSGKQVPADVVYALVPGFDSALFTIPLLTDGEDAGASTNCLRFAAPTFASPLDANGDNIYVAAWKATSTNTGQVTFGFTEVRVIQLVVGSAQRYVGPATAGTGDGSSWANQAIPDSINALIGQVGPGGFVNVANDQGDYAASAFNGTTITNGGGPGSGVITIRGVNSSGVAGNVPINGTRTPFTPPLDPETPTDVSAWVDGEGVFILGDGANNLKFLNWAPTNVGSMWHAVGSFHGFTIDTVDAFNFQRLFEQEHQTCVGNLTARDVTGAAFSKQGWRMRGASHDFSWLRTYMDSMRQNKDKFAVSYEISDFAHDWIMDTCTGHNAYSDVGGAGAFWNGDGCSAEHSNYNGQFINCSFNGNADAGIDCKGANVTLTDTDNGDNRANYKLWYNTFVLSGVVSRAPRAWGGTGAKNHIDSLGAIIYVKDASEFHDTDAGCITFRAEITGAGNPNTASHLHIASDTVEDTLGTRFVSTGATGSTIDDLTATPWIFVGATDTTSASGNITGSEPAGTSTIVPRSVDLMIACVDWRDTANFTIPAGWTLCGTPETSANAVNGGPTAIASGLMAYIVRPSSAPSLTFTRTGGSLARCIIGVWRKFDGTAPVLDVYNSATQGAGTTTPALGSITTTAANALIVGFLAGCRTGGVSAWAAATDPATASSTLSNFDYPHPGKWTERVDGSTATNPTVSGAVYDAIRATAGATGAFSATAVISRQAMLAAAFK